MTNYERIKNMSVDEMAELISDGVLNAVSTYTSVTESWFREYRMTLINWLKSEVEE